LGRPFAASQQEIDPDAEPQALWPCQESEDLAIHLPEMEFLVRDFPANHGCHV